MKLMLLAGLTETLEVLMAKMVRDAHELAGSGSSGL